MASNNQTDDDGESVREQPRWRDFAESGGVDTECTETLSSGEIDHVTMSMTVDVSDMNARDTAVLMELADLYEDSFREVCEKNRDLASDFGDRA